MKSKTLMSCVFVLMAISIGHSQPPGGPDGPGSPVMGERLKSMHAAYITDRLRLSPEEAQAFWPLYNEFQDQEKSIKDKYRPGKKPEEMTEEEAVAQLDRTLQMEREVLDLKATYFGRLRQVVPASKLVLLYQAEREFKEQLIREMQNRRQERMEGRRRRN